MFEIQYQGDGLKKTPTCNKKQNKTKKGHIINSTHGGRVSWKCA